MKLSALTGFILGLLMATSSLCAQPYGLDQPQPIGAYLNNIFPHTAPSSSASWNTEVAFTNITFDQPIFMLPYPGTNRLVMLHKTGRITTFPNRRNVLPTEEAPFLDISSRTFTLSDSGMTGCAFHPEFGQPGSTNRGYFYITYKWRPPGASGSGDFACIRLSRFTEAGRTNGGRSQFRSHFVAAVRSAGISRCRLSYVRCRRVSLFFHRRRRWRE